MSPVSITETVASSNFAEFHQSLAMTSGHLPVLASCSLLLVVAFLPVSKVTIRMLWDSTDTIKQAYYYLVFAQIRYTLERLI